MPGFGPIGSAPIGGTPTPPSAAAGAAVTRAGAYGLGGYGEAAYGEATFSTVAAAGVTIRRGVGYAFGPYAGAPYADVTNKIGEGPTPSPGFIGRSRFVHATLPYIDGWHLRRKGKSQDIIPPTINVKMFRRNIHAILPFIDGWHLRRRGISEDIVPPKVLIPHRFVRAILPHIDGWHLRRKGFQRGPLEFNRSIGQTLTFGTALARLIEYSRSAEDVFTFGQLAETNIKYFELESSITFSPALDRNTEISREINNIIRFSQEARRTFVEAVNSLITFSQGIAKGESVESVVTFGQVVAVVQSTGIDNEITFGQQVTPNVEYTRSLDSTITFGVNTQGYVINGCDLHEYLPIGAALESVTQGSRTTVIFSRGGDSVELRNPQFGNVEAHDIRRILRETRGGTIRIGQRSIWAKEVNLTLTFRGLTRAKADELLVFIQDNLGQRIDYLDQENQSWQGVILSVTDPMIDESGDDCLYTISVEYVANRQ